MSTALLPGSGWKNHSEQTGDDALKASAWGITTELVSGVVVMSRIDHAFGGYRVTVFEPGVTACSSFARKFHTPNAAKMKHYTLVSWLISMGKIHGL